MLALVASAEAYLGSFDGQTSAPVIPCASWMGNVRPRARAQSSPQ